MFVVYTSRIVFVHLVLQQFISSPNAFLETFKESQMRVVAIEKKRSKATVRGLGPFSLARLSPTRASDSVLHG